MPIVVWPSIETKLGLDLIGDNFGSIRIENIVIEDVTAAFLPGMLDWVDVRDFGAKGLEQTLAARAGSPVAMVGIGANAAEAFAPSVHTVDGMSIAVLAATQLRDHTTVYFRAGEDKAVESLKSKIARYDKEKAEISEKAKGFEQKRDDYRAASIRSSAKDDKMGLSVSLFQIAIAVGSICLVIKKKSSWYISLALSSARKA